MSERHEFTLLEVVRITGLERSEIISFIQKEWILPPETEILDEEDVARIRLIRELKDDFGVNDEAIPLILHLLDRLLSLTSKLSDSSTIG
jgi:chaperone modulatory protein CbpM